MNLSKTYLTARAATVGLLLSLVWAGCQPAEIATSDSPSFSGAKQSTDAEYVDGELIIQFAEGTSAEVKQKALDKVQGKNAEKILTKSMEKAGKKEGLLLVKVNKNVLEAVADLANTEGVDFAEPNFIYQHATATDPNYTNGNLWGMYGPATTPANAFGSNAAAAWAAGRTGSAAVYVGIIDEGIQILHPDLSGQFWTNPNEITDDRVDNDGNGLVDDINGWDFANNDNTVYDGGATGSTDNHGTHVAGTIGAKANNGVGVVGVNWNITMISGKFLGATGGTLANAVKAVDYFTNLKITKGLNIVATNNSWGGGGFSQALFDAISRANTAGILFIAAAGNSGTNNDRKASYPSGYNLPNVIAVAAIDRTGALASFSQYGATSVDIGAPGVAILSTTANNGGYSSYNGTSMATPHVAGAAALYAAAKPGSSATTIKNAILSGAVSTPSLVRKTVTGGRLDVNAALAR